MGQYKLQVILRRQLKIGIGYKMGFSINIDILCFNFYFGLLSCAKGYGFRKDLD